MTAAYRVVDVERKDIETVTVVCPECGSEVSVLIATSLAPEACPSCRRPYGENVLTALAGLARFQRLGKAEEQGTGKPIFKFYIQESA
jgi:hypothetical protein